MVYDNGLVSCEADQLKQADASLILFITTTGGPPTLLNLIAIDKITALYSGYTSTVQLKAIVHVVLYSLYITSYIAMYCMLAL